MDEQLLALLKLISEQGGVSTAKAAKKLRLAQSQLLRLLAVLSEDPSLGGLGLVEVKVESARTLLYLSAKGQQWSGAHP